MPGGLITTRASRGWIGSAKRARFHRRITATAALALEQGEVDYINGVNGPDIARLQANRDVVLVKGSLGSRMAPIVEALRALEGQALPRAANGN